MHNESALLLRLYEQHTITSPLLLINPPDDPGVYRALNIAGVLHDNYQNYQRWQLTDTPKWFACHLPGNEFSNQKNLTVVLFLPKGKQRLLAQLQLLGGRIAPGCRVIVIGAVDTGIKSAGKKISAFSTQVQKLDAARHCQAWSGICKFFPPVKINALFNYWPLEFADQTLTIASLPGVFADGYLDSGSRLLMETLYAHKAELPRQASVLDFGSGSGLLSVIAFALLPDAKITAVDCDAFALAASAVTFEKNHLQGVIRPTANPADVDGQFQLIISNPPFHQGVSQTTRVTNGWLEQLPKLLAKQGSAHIVANKFLAYEVTCQASGLKVFRSAENRGYKVLEIQHT